METTTFRLFNARIVNEGEIFPGSVWCRDGRIDKIHREDQNNEPVYDAGPSVDLEGRYLMPGVIDDQVHFREPGLTHKADIYSESRAAVAGGITSFMEMPNTVPNTLTQELLEKKYQRAAETSFANYSFYMGVSNDNLEEVLKTDARTVCGIKIFMGASTGNMLVDDINTLEGIFSGSKMLVAVHCEDETTIRNNLDKAIEKWGESIPIEAHPDIRSHEACYKSSSLAVSLAKKYNTRLHVLHLSTARELELFTNAIPLGEKRITSEVCVHHLWFARKNYKSLGARIKWNPAIKDEADRSALLQGLLDNKLDVVATDHAPHTKEEKNNPYLKAPSGGPLVQHALPAMLELFHEKKISLEKIVEKMCHAPAECFRIVERGYIRPGYWADLVVLDIGTPFRVTDENILYKCQWSPFEGMTFRSSIHQTFVNGNLIFDRGKFNKNIQGQRLLFNPDL
jgi:dihydroorotase